MFFFKVRLLPENKILFGIFPCYTKTAQTETKLLSGVSMYLVRINFDWIYLRQIIGGCWLK